MTTIKVNRVTTAELAHELDRAGVGIIGVPMVIDTRFAEPWRVDAATARAIVDVVERATVVAHVDGKADPDAVRAELAAAGITRVELAAHPEPRADLLRALREDGIAIGYCRLVASLDDDPEWLLGSIADVDPASIDRVELELAPDHADGWAALKQGDPDDELRLGDVDLLASSRTLFVSVGLSGATAAEIATHLPCVAGLSFHLGTANPANCTAHAIDLRALRATLAHVVGRGPR